MPIIDLQRRTRQLGEIRIGEVVSTSNGKTRPAKLDRFRLTSPSRRLLEHVAHLYGGAVQPWTPANGGPAEWEVKTDVDRLPILLPPQSVTQWYELYQGSRCVRRCDGVTEQKNDQPCVCDPDQRECAITTRLNVILRDVPGIGVWLLTTRGWYAATELPTLAEFIVDTGGYAPAYLGLEERVVKTDTETRRFMVPIVEIDVTPAQLMAGRNSPAAITDGHEITVDTGAQSAAIDPAGLAYWLRRAVDCTTTEELSTLVTVAKDAAAWTDELATMFRQRWQELHDTAKPVTTADDPDELWAQIMRIALDHGLHTLTDLERDFAEQSGGVMPDSATVEQMRTYLNRIRQQETV